MRVVRPLVAGEEYVPVTDSLVVVPAVLISRFPDEIAPAPSALTWPAIVCAEVDERPVVCTA